METLQIIQIVAGTVAVGLIIWAVLAAILGGQVEVDPGTALVYKEIISGRPWGKMPGVGFLMPWQRELRRISLRNEPVDPPGLVKVNTADPIEVGVDYIFKTFRVLQEAWAIRKVFEVINYDSRLENVVNRVNLAIKDALNQRGFDEIYLAEKIQRDVIKKIEDEVNVVLQSLREEWGLEVVIGIKEIEIPGAIADAREDREMAKYEGAAIRDKAAAAGEGRNVRDVIFADAIADAIRGLRGGKS